MKVKYICNNNGQHLQRWQEQLLLPGALVRKVSVQCLLKDAYKSACRLGMCSIKNGVSLLDTGMELKTRLRFKLEGL